MDVTQIEKLEDVFLCDGDKIIDHKVKRLTKPGENYGSLMLSVDITLESNKLIQAVAKMIPPNEFVQEMFNTQVTFPNEINFYKTIIPTLQDFQREKGISDVIDFTPKYYGARLNLDDDSNAKVDANAVLLQENLKVANFTTLDRTKGFDLEVTKLVLKDLAYLHGVPLALKLEKPDVFETKIKPYLAPWRMNDKGVEETREFLHKIFESLDGCKPFLKRIDKVLSNTYNDQSGREPFATITHNDCWVNNVMVQQKNGKPIKTKLVDFQVCDYGSPAKDVIFFLFSSVQNDVLMKHYDELIQLYHTTFISVLRKLDCDTSQFSFKSFEKELNYEASHSQFYHIGFMVGPILASGDNVKDISELAPDTMGDMKITDAHKQKLMFVVKEFVKRNWL